MARIRINGKFLGAPLNGVHRTAAEFCEQLVQRTSRDHDIAIVSPHPSAPLPEFPHVISRPAPGPFGAGQAWEMLTLPWVTRSSLLVNFCNLSPLLHGNSLVMIHDAQTFLYPEDYSGRQARAYRRLLPWIGRRARRILTVSEFSRQSLARFGIGTPHKIDVVHNGTDHLLRQPADRGVLQTFGLAPGSYVLVLGSAKGYKNMRTVFEALRAPLPTGHRLVVAGGPERESYLAKGWEPPSDTMFTGFVTDPQLRGLYEGASAFLFPSLTEGFGLPPVEAMHCRTPVIAADAGAMPEVCAEAALLVPPENPAEYRGALTAVLSDTGLAENLVARGLSRAQSLSWSAAGTRLWEVLQPHLPLPRARSAPSTSLLGT